MMRHACAFIALCLSLPTVAAPVKFALIGDFGNGSQSEADVASRLKSHNPQFVLTLGDNNYLGPTVADMDRAIGRDYHPFIKYPANSTSAYRNQGASQINFYPLVGNHDWDEGIALHSSYYTFPSANARYYDVRRGPVHFFLLDNDPREPDGITSPSVQANWLRTTMAASTARWKLVLTHFPPYSSKGSFTDGRWPYAEWGATHVLSGHRHNYERLVVDGLTYFVNGLGGEAIHTGATPMAGSRALFDDDYGFMLVDADDNFIDFQFITRAGQIVDSVIEVDGAYVPATPEPHALLVLALAPLLRRTRRRTPHAGA